jgi:hypothetical protein
MPWKTGSMNIWMQLTLGLVLILMGFVISLSTGLFSEGLEYQVRACDMSREEQLNDSLDILILSDSITFSQILNTYCNAGEDNLKLFYMKRGNVLEVREVFDDSTAARCVCPLRIQGTITGLSSNDYTLKFVFDNRYTGQEGVVREFNVSLS